MTIIAWDGRTMSADRCGWDGETRVHMPKKIHVIDTPSKGPVAVGFAGRFTFAAACLKALGGKGEWPDPDQYAIARDVIVGLVVPIGKRRAWIIESTGDWAPLEERVWAIGSARTIALGALLAGATSRRACEIARDYTDHAGYGIQTVYTRVS
jgi:hypothetical protein